MKRLGEEEARDRTKVQVIDLLKTEGETWASFLEGVSEDFLAKAFTMPPGATPATKILQLSQRAIRLRPHLHTLAALIAYCCVWSPGSRGCPPTLVTPT